MPMDREAAKEALALYDAQASDAKFLATLAREDWSRVSFSLSVEGYAPLRGSYQDNATPILKMATNAISHEPIAKNIADYAKAAVAEGARRRMAERNRRLAQLGFAAWVSA